VNVKQERKERKFSDSDNPIKIEKFLFFSFLFFLIVLLSNINNVTEKVKERNFSIATKQKNSMEIVSIPSLAVRMRF